jgi:hypothetical protein
LADSTSSAKASSLDWLISPIMFWSHALASTREVLSIGEWFWLSKDSHIHFLTFCFSHDFLKCALGLKWTLSLIPYIIHKAKYEIIFFKND